MTNEEMLTQYGELTPREILMQVAFCHLLDGGAQSTGGMSPRTISDDSCNEYATRGLDWFLVERLTEALSVLLFWTARNEYESTQALSRIGMTSPHGLKLSMEVLQHHLALHVLHDMMH